MILVLPAQKGMKLGDLDRLKSGVRFTPPITPGEPGQYQCRICRYQWVDRPVHFYRCPQHERFNQ